MTMSERPYWVIDCETIPIDGAETFLETPTAPSNYTKPEAIGRYIFEQTAKNLEKASLDIDLARVCVFGMNPGTDFGYPTALWMSQDEERSGLESFWSAFTAARIRPIIVGFFNSQYDVPLLVRRAQLLGVKVPEMDLAKYRHPDVLDLAQYLTFDWHPSIKAHSLSFYAKRFGLPHDDTVKGADVGRLFKEGNYEAIRKHCEDDLATTAALARRLGLMP